MQAIIAADGGVETVTPLSIVTWTAEAVKRSGADASDRVVGLIGESIGGAPGTAFVFNDPTSAAKTLISGELLKGVQYAFSNGSGATPRAVVAVNALGGNPASYAVKDATNKVVFTLTTLTYREPANQTTLSLTGSRASGFNLQIKDPVTGAALGYTRLGLGLYLQYTGGGKTAAVSVSTVAGVKYLSTTITGGAPGEGVSIPLAGLTLRQLGQQIISSGPYNVYAARNANLAADGLDETTAPVSIMTYGVIGTTASPTVAGGDTVTLAAASSRALVAGEILKLRVNGSWLTVQVAADAAAGTSFTIAPITNDIPAGANVLDASTAAPVALSAVKADIKDFLVTRGKTVVSYADGDDDAADPKVQGGNFTGGGTLAASLASWNDATEALLEADFGVGVALTDDQGLVFGVRAALQAARNPAVGKFIQLFTGADADTLPSDNSDPQIQSYQRDTAAMVATINDRDSVYFAQAADAVNPVTGQLGRIKPYLVAAMAAGYAASVGRSVSMTYKSLACSNPFPNLTRYKNAFTLAGATVLVPPKKSQSARIELGRTTWVGEDNTIYESEKSVRLMNGIARDVKLLQEHLVPGESTVSRLAEYKKELTRYLDGLVKDQLLQAGYDQDGNKVAPYTFKIERTQYQGRYVRTLLTLNPTGEFVVAETKILARPVEIEI